MSSPMDPPNPSRPAFPGASGALDASVPATPSSEREEARPTPAPSTSGGSSVARRLALGAVAVGAGVILGYVGKPDSSSDSFINFDPESTPPAVLASGWSGFEAMPPGDTFVWCASKSCVLAVPTGHEEDRIIRVRLWPFLFPDSPSQTVEVFVNGTSLGTKPLTALPSVLSFPAAKGVWKSGPNELRFRFAYAVMPKSKYPDSEDPRELAAAFDWVEIARPARVPPAH